MLDAHGCSRSSSSASPRSERSPAGSSTGAGAEPAGCVANLLALAQTLLVAQVGLGLLLLADDRNAADALHYVYGSLSLGAILAPWMYAPAAGPKRLLWFAGTSLLAAALAVRAFMTGS